MSALRSPSFGSYYWSYFCELRRMQPMIMSHTITKICCSPSLTQNSSPSLFCSYIFQYCLIPFRIFPCCSTSRKRKIWRKRIKERRWHVYVAREEPEDWFLAALERYRAAQQREDEAHRQGNVSGNSLTQVAADIVWKEKDEPELRKALTDDLLRDYTKVSPPSSHLKPDLG